MAIRKSKTDDSRIEELEAALRAETDGRLAAEKNLRCAEEEFAKFILTAAHDLASPIRTVSAYSELLTRKDAGRSEEDKEQFRRFVIDGTTKVQALIAGIVDYVNASSEIAYSLPVDMNEVFREAGASPGIQSATGRVVITSDPLPVIRGDAERVTKVARHLLDNAAKFCGREECRIHISSKPEDSGHLFTVSDNGPGIQEAYRLQIFEPFKRLHGREYAGSGLGLAFCRKAIESHGGRIWVDPTPEAGSAFCFTLPGSL